MAKCAFVTFMDQEGKERCLQAYPSWTWYDVLKRLCYSKTSKFHGSSNISGRGFLPESVQAPEPSDIIWENLTTPAWLRAIKSTITSALIFSQALIATLPGGCSWWQIARYFYAPGECLARSEFSAPPLLSSPAHLVVCDA